MGGSIPKVYEDNLCKLYFDSRKCECYVNLYRGMIESDGLMGFYRCNNDKSYYCMKEMGFSQYHGVVPVRNTNKIRAVGFFILKSEEHWETIRKKIYSKMLLIEENPRFIGEQKTNLIFRYLLKDFKKIEFNKFTIVRDATICIILKHTETGKFYRQIINRSGQINIIVGVHGDFHF